MSLFRKRRNNPVLDHLPAGGIDRMRDVGIQLGTAIVVLGGLLLLQTRATLVAKSGAKMVLAAALRTVSGQLSTWHRHEGPCGALDDLQVAHDERIVERDRAKCLESFSRLVHELDANLGDFHGCSPLRYGRSNSNFVLQVRYPRRLPLNVSPGAVHDAHGDKAQSRMSRFRSFHVRGNPVLQTRTVIS